MRTYSDFFKTIYDETSPTGYLGQGTHYSVFRAVVFHDQNGRPLSEGQFADFAVIWDEDRDERVLEPIEKIYRRGLLSSFLMFGERKAGFTAVLSDKVRLVSKADTDKRIQSLKAQISAICESLDDAWFSQVVDRDGDETMSLHLKRLEMRWQLGITRQNKPRKRAVKWPRGP